MKKIDFKTKKSLIEIYPQLCKGCYICEEFCPKKVLKVVDFKITIVNDECLVCKACEMRCPDFAILVTKTDETNKGDEE